MFVASWLLTVAVVVPLPPTDFTSLKAIAYSTEVRSGRGPHLNEFALGMDRGVTSLHLAPKAIGLGVIGSFLHIPGAVPA